MIPRVLRSCRSPVFLLPLGLLLASLPAWAKAEENGGPRFPTELEWLRFLAVSAVIVGGALGGLIYGISRNRGAVLPHPVSLPKEADPSHPSQKNGAATYVKWNLGFIADLLIGIGGGVIIFNLVPTSSDTDLFTQLIDKLIGQPGDSIPWGQALSLLMKILALALIGGFAGISLFDEAAKRISRDLEEVRNQVATAEGEVQRLNNVAEQESSLQVLLSTLVDPTLPPLSQSQQDRFHRLLEEAPLHLRNKVFERCQKAQSDHRLPTDGSRLPVGRISSLLTLQEGLLTAFDALIAAADAQERAGNGVDAYKHRYLAHRGFIHKQLALGRAQLGEPTGVPGHWRSAEESLDQAIALRDRSEEDRRTYWHYNLDRMLARFHLGEKDRLEAELDSSELRSWLEDQQRRGFVQANLRALPEDFRRLLASHLPGLVLEDAASPAPGGTDEAAAAAGATELTPLERIRRGESL